MFIIPFAANVAATDSAKIVNAFALPGQHQQIAAFP